MTSAASRILEFVTKAREVKSLQTNLRITIFLSFKSQVTCYPWLVVLQLLNLNTVLVYAVRLHRVMHDKYCYSSCYSSPVASKDTPWPPLLYDVSFLLRMFMAYLIATRITSCWCFHEQQELHCIKLSHLLITVLPGVAGTPKYSSVVNLTTCTCRVGILLELVLAGIS